MNENIFKQSAALMKDNILTIQPLFLWVIIMMFVSAPLASKKSIDASFCLTVSIVFLSLTAFLSGWYNCIKTAISNKNKVYSSIEEKNKAQFDTLKSFFPGVTEYMLPVTIYTIVYVLCGYFLTQIYRYFSFKIFALKNFPADMLNIINTGTQEEISKYIQANLSNEQLITLTVLLLGVIVLFLLFSVIVLWLAPALYYSGKSPVVLLKSMFSFLFKHFGMSIQIVVVMFIINTIISFLSMFMSSGFLAFIPVLLTFGYLMYYVVTVFLYYESKEQNNCDCGTKLDRQV